MYKEVLEGMSEGVLVLDVVGKIVFANQAIAEIFSLANDGFIGKRLLEVIRLVELSDLVEAVRRSGQPVEREMKLVFPAEKNLLGLANLAGDNIAVIIRDITAMKQLESLRSDFVANVSHELKTPLTAIKGYVDTLVAGAIDDPDNNRRFLEKIAKNADSLAALIDDILALSRLEVHRGIAPFEKVFLADEIEKALETLAPAIKEKRIEIVNLSGGAVVGEPSQLYRAILNLLDNAIKYSHPGGKVEIVIAKTEKELCLSVTDHGMGIPAEHHARIFERFYRVDKARSREMGGTGLGLAIVKHIMEIHGGRVELKSAAGQGAKFTLVFVSRHL
ncbi:hypothetical protein A3H38_06850 [candidate division WOR-1 bacterium RIFCSPLOWO2_02_FULL_46_20]|uniref:histidine kinase n=2 Tax=Saganbacteria TaxID=1703751 RepID=A0A1F4R871_UNCSA|nr:MAG: hypothetical protein A3J44_03340 [candidate division WOR-1 bacterium RIFCSPHIGHO2_02_FULL_45_12]OGC04364.1 MAG: hypothetical protein A3H38_06850 [candidate division WOR-1 bacterium RIFCSPLOWO2_02_FULL_46_20]OGC10114.1 MAG: hypothetical protein A3F86_02040 [candidate division WOR-1 bacterium RIFCSPLOWO2_12_FULL_45_9]